jgi:HSP20 family protein
MNSHDVAIRREHDARSTEFATQYRVPVADVYETSDTFVLMLDLPGATRDSISLTLDKGEMRVKADVKRPHTDEGTLLINEMYGAGFYRAFSIGEGIDTRAVEARFEQGVLTVTLNKSEDLKPREIRIN